MESVTSDFSPVAGASGSAAAPALSRIPELSPSKSAPVDRTERITALDSLRGFALLGILLMNIIAFGMYGGAYDDPSVTGGSTGANLWIWAVLHVVAEGKMRALFSLVFGASVILLTSRLESRGDAADIYYRRTLWLVAFGIADAYLLWLGDILYPYALCGLALYPFRKMKPKNLIVIGTVLLLFNSAFYAVMGMGQREMIEKGQAAEKAAAAGQKLTAEQEEAKKSYEGWRRFMRPSQEQLDSDAKKWRGNALDVIKVRAKLVSMFHGKPYYSPMNWDIWCMMFIGMGIFKLGILSAEKPARYYATMMLVGYGIGIPVNAYTAWFIVKHNFDPAMHAFANTTYDLGRLTVALGHLGLVMILAKSGAMRWLTDRLGAIGQMAFSSYVTHSVICTIIFTGIGFGMYGRLQRYQLYYVVAAIWVFQLIVSPIWLRHFRFGPLEWCWRSLTYWQKQPMRLRAPVPSLQPVVENQMATGA
jgi:uncharacterized protein